MVENKTIGLITFLKGSSNPAERMPGCANYDHHYGGCLFADVCKVQQGQRCGYFEKAVLPTAADIGLKEQVYSLYYKHVGIEQDVYKIEIGEIRRCPGFNGKTCGAPLLPRRRYCDKCRDRKRRDDYRKRRDK